MSKQAKLIKQVITLLKELHLPSFRATLEHTLEAAHKDNWSFIETLHELLQIECVGRRNNRISRYLRE